MGESANPPNQNLGSQLGSIAGASGPLINAEQQLAGYDVNTLYPQMAGQEVAATSQARQGTLSNLSNMGGAYQSAIGALNPNWQTDLNSLSGSALAAASNQPGALLGQMNSEAQGAAPSALTNQLTATASQQLALGSGLSSGEARQAQQTALAGANAQGRANGNGALASEVLNTDQYGQQLLSARESAAGAANQQGLQNQQINQGFQSTVQGQNQQQTAQNQNFLMGATQVQQNALAPTLGFFSPSTQTPVSVTSPASLMSSAQGAYDPMMSYGSNLYDTNYNAQAATLLNNANNTSALWGAGIGAIGSLAGGAMG
jgi:hypothetical protein